MFKFNKLWKQQKEKKKKTNNRKLHQGCKKKNKESF